MARNRYKRCICTGRKLQNPDGTWRCQFGCLPIRASVRHKGVGVKPVPDGITEMRGCKAPRAAFNLPVSEKAAAESRKRRWAAGTL